MRMLVSVEFADAGTKKRFQCICDGAVTTQEGTPSSCVAKCLNTQTVVWGVDDVAKRGEGPMM
jgi:hypothetical protein